MLNKLLKNYLIQNQIPILMVMKVPLVEPPYYHKFIKDLFFHKILF